MFRTFSLTSGLTLLRSASPTCTGRFSRIIPAAPKAVREDKKTLYTEVSAADGAASKPVLSQTNSAEKPKRKYTRRKAPTETNADSSTAQAATGDGQQNAAEDGTPNTKRAPKKDSTLGERPQRKYTRRTIPAAVNNVEALASGASDGDKVSKYLQMGYATTRAARKSAHLKVADGKRVHVLSKKLCGKITCIVHKSSCSPLLDDVLERLKPSLEKHIGCDILDLNPGPGIWSSTLHDFLKPRTHILMEPDDAFYKPLLQPLIDAEGSTYKFIPKSGVVWASLQEALSSELLPHQEVLEKEDHRLEAPNNTLLLVANLGYNPRKPYRGFPSITNLVIHQLLSAARSHSLVHKYGLVRMLIWVDNEEKKMILPRTIQLRRKATVEAEITCRYIAEVASSTDTAGYMRDPNLDLKGSIAVLGKMKDAGISTPKDRQGNLEIEATQTISNSQSTKAGPKIPGHKKLDDLERQFAAGAFSMFQDTPEGRLASEVVLNPDRVKSRSPEWDRMTLLINKEKDMHKKGYKFHYGDELRQLQEGFASGELRKYTALENNYGGSGKVIINKHYTPEFRALNTLRIMHRGAEANKAKAAVLAAEYEAIISMCKQVATLEGAAATQLQEKIDASYEIWRENIALVNKDITLGVVYHMMDNSIAFSQDPPILYWDRRTAEPLKAEPEEFFPGTEMALLDFQPQTLWPLLRENFAENYDVLEFFLSNLLVSPVQSVREGITSLAPGAFEYLIPECPSITDPRKGGSPFLETMTVRSLTLEMYKELLEAWLKWPFRPSRYELLSKMGSDVYDPEFGDLGLPESG